jgi:hypothetical protein
MLVLRKRSIGLMVIMLTILFTSLQSNAQISRSAYFLNHLPASNVLNPAFHPEYKYYINLPVVSSFYLGFESPVTFNELTGKWKTGDSLYIDRAGIINSLEKKNYFSFEYYNELGRLGVSAGKHYFHFSIAKVFSTKFSFDKNLVALFLFGNADERFFGKNTFFDQTGINMNLYHQMALGYSFQVSDKVTLGTGVKYLNGSINILTKKADLSLYTDNTSNFPLTASSDLHINTSSTISSFDNMIDQVSGYGWFDLTKNHGFGFDLGINVNASEKFSMSASVVDFGWIKWKDNVKTFRSEKPGQEFTFEGFDITEFISGGSFSDSLGLLDTLKSHFQVQELHEPYTSHLTPKIYLASTWHLHKAHDIAAMVRTDLLEERIQPSLTINYLFKLKDFLTLYANYSIVANNYWNIGAGFSAKLGPVQLYLLNDMAYSLYSPREARYYNFQFGINFLFKKIEKEPFNGIKVL